MDEYIKEIFEELFHEDGLVVLGHGLGIKRLFSKFVQLYLHNGDKKRIVLCVNASEWINYTLQHLAYESPNNITLHPKVITNEISTQDRCDMYLQGGCFFVTSRILIVDFLDGKIDPSAVAGLLIANAHKISETSIESFILRVFREKNVKGFIKAFTEDPESLVGGFCKVERLMKALYLKKLYLYPRFQKNIATILDSMQPEVIELAQPITENMRGIQSAVLVGLNTTIAELKKAVPQLDTTFMTLENSLFRSFDITLRTQLDPEWHRLSPRTKQLVADLSQLRKLLDYLLRYDAYTFYAFLLSLRSASAIQTFPSLWLSSHAADLMFRKSKDRMYTTEQTPPSDSVANLSRRLQAVCEVPPKWTLLTEVISEIKTDIFQRKQRHVDMINRKISCDVRPDLPLLSGRVMVIVKDERTAMHVRDLLCYGSDFVRDQRHRWFISQQAADIRSKATLPVRSSSASSLGRFSSNSQCNKLSHFISTVADDPSSSTFIGNSTDLPGWRSEAVEEDRVLIDELPRTDDNNYLGTGLNRTSFDCLSEDSKLILIHEVELKAVAPILPVAFAHETKTPTLDPDEAIYDSDVEYVSDRQKVQIDTQESLVYNVATIGTTVTDSETKPSKRKTAIKSSSAPITPKFKLDENLTSETFSKNKNNISSISSNPQNIKRRRKNQDNSETEGTIDVYKLMKTAEDKVDRGISDMLPSTVYFEHMRKQPILLRHHLNRNSKYRLPTQLSAVSTTTSNSIALLSANNCEESSDTNSFDSQQTEEAPVDSFHVVVLTHAETHDSTDLLFGMQPAYVVLYDVEVATVRYIETYHSRSPTQPLRVYLLMYEDSAEEHRYLSALGREKRAFEQLIAEKESMAIALPDSVADIERAKIEDVEVGASGSSSVVLGDGRVVASDSRKKKEFLTKTFKIVVDVRDFRSSLPSLLHLAGCTIIPRTLLVGDFVLSPEICVERKGISDLFQSLASGRLYHQSESMLRHYRLPCLLIEFGLERSFTLQSTSDIHADSIQANSVVTRLVQLTLAFPGIRILWSRSPHMTVEIFQSLMQRHEEVDVDRAVCAGADHPGFTFGGTEDGVGESTNAGDREEVGPSAKDILLSLPGVTVHNFRTLMGRVNSVAELVALSLNELTALLGSASGCKLHEFMHHHPSL